MDLTCCGEDNVMLKWPLRSPVLISCLVFLWGLFFSVPLLAENVNELKQRITAALETVIQDMLQHVWEERDYRLGVCRITGGAHIELL